MCVLEWYAATDEVVKRGDSLKWSEKLHGSNPDISTLSSVCRRNPLSVRGLQGSKLLDIAGDLFSSSLLVLLRQVVPCFLHVLATSEVLHFDGQFATIPVRPIDVGDRNRRVGGYVEKGLELGLLTRPLDHSSGADTGYARKAGASKVAKEDASEPDAE